jgi:hypothetical protein
MKSLINIIFLILFCTLSAFSQANNTLSGTLIDKTSKEPIFSGSVELLRAVDSVFVDGALSNEKGEFDFRNIKPDRYV